MIYVLKKNDKAEDSEKIVKLLKSMSPNGKRDVGLKELVERWMKERERKAQNYELWRCGKFGAYKDLWTLPKWCNGLVKEVDMASVSKEEKQILEDGNDWNHHNMVSQIKVDYRVTQTSLAIMMSREEGNNRNHFWNDG